MSLFSRQVRTLVILLNRQNKRLLSSGHRTCSSRRRTRRPLHRRCFVSVAMQHWRPHAPFPLFVRLPSTSPSSSSSYPLFGVSTHWCSMPASKEVNYFQLLKLPQRFDIDDSEIRLNFQKAMKTCHPDKFANHSMQEQKEAQRVSSQLNTARTVLESPLFRAQHLLSLMHCNEVDSILDKEYQIMDQNFLLQIMDIRLNVESTKDVSSLQQMLEDNCNRMKQLTQQIAAEFAFDSTVNGKYQIPQQNVESIRELLAKLTYFHRVEGEIKDKLPPRD